MPSPGVKARIDRFWRATRRLNKIHDVGLKGFIESEDLTDAAERNLQVAVEAAIDVGEALIAYMDWRTPKSYRDVGRILEERGVLDKGQAEAFQEALKLRSILIHNYIYISPEGVYNSIEGLKDKLTGIMSSVIGYMQRQGVDP